VKPHNLQDDCLAPHKRIPHRYPFLFVDEITDYEKEKWITGIKKISCNDRIDLYLSPVLLCEALAQLSKLLESFSEDTFQQISYLTSLQIDFFESVAAGDVIELFARKEKEFHSMVSYVVTASCDGKKLVEGTLFRKKSM
jgi:3-hydroxyacyl-[acyl-carrier-protein] dehydratase